MAVDIQPVQANDLNELRDISIETFSQTFGSANSQDNLQEYLNTAYQPSKLAKELADLNSEFYFIFYDHDLAGYLKLNVDNSQTEKMGAQALEIERIYIRKKFKRLGLGSQLFNFSLARAQKLNKKTIWLGVWEYNEGAKAFYNKKGFVPFGDHVFELGGDPQRDILMKRDV